MRATLACMTYGGTHWATVEALFQETTLCPDWFVALRPADAAIDRNRAKIATQVLDEGASDVLVMVDHDVSWVPGDALYLAEAARRTKGVVGAVVSKKTHGLGYGSRMPDGVRAEIRTPTLVEMPPHSYCGGALMAIHVSVLERLAATLGRTAEGWYPFFAPCSLVRPDGVTDWLSEDWALCHYARDVADAPVHTALWPLTQHHGGDYGYTAFDACPHEHVREV